MHPIQLTFRKRENSARMCNSSCWLAAPIVSYYSALEHSLLLKIRGSVSHCASVGMSRTLKMWPVGKSSLTNDPWSSISLSTLILSFCYSKTDVIFLSSSRKTSGYQIAVNDRLNFYIANEQNSYFPNHALFLKKGFSCSLSWKFFIFSPCWASTASYKTSRPSAICSMLKEAAYRRTSFPATAHKAMAGKLFRRWERSPHTAVIIRSICPQW